MSRRHARANFLRDAMETERGLEAVELAADAEAGRGDGPIGRQDAVAEQAEALLANTDDQRQRRRGVEPETEFVEKQLHVMLR